MKKIVLLFLAFLLFGACEQKSSSTPSPKGNFSIWQACDLIQDTLKVKIPIEGKLMAWHKLDLLAPMDAKVISLLVETNDPVKKGDLLMHLWPLKHLGNYTPSELFSPMDGIIAELYVNLADTVKQGELLLSIENRQNLTLRAKLYKWQIPFVKRNANVVLRYNDLQIKGAVIDIDSKEDWVTVIVPNQQLQLKEDLYLHGYIELPNTSGNFLPAPIFGENDSVLMAIDNETTLTVFRVGVVDDSLVFIAPSLPGIKTVQVKKNLDINK